MFELVIVNSYSVRAVLRASTVDEAADICS